MRILNREQAKVLLTIVNKTIADNQDKGLIEVINQLNIKTSLETNNFAFIARNDVRMVAQGMYDHELIPEELTEHQIETVTNQVISTYDYSEYNDSIADVIRELYGASN